jgi:putative component of toxin-antitoxin plasmid stabilization module
LGELIHLLLLEGISELRLDFGPGYRVYYGRQGEKSLHRMLGRNGNPAIRNLGAIVRSIAEDLGVKPRVEVAACR